jgi:hypothetical protein
VMKVVRGSRRVCRAWRIARYLTPYSPDLNPIEHVWAYVKAILAKMCPQPTSKDALFEAAQQIWDEMPQEVIDNIVDSMGKRISDVFAAKGGPTKY